MRPFTGIGLFVCAGTAVLASIVTASGCTVLTNDSAPDDAGVFDGSNDGAAPVCATCLADQCTGQWAVCLTDPDCLAVAKRAASAACVGPDGSAADGGAEDGGADPLALYGAFAACSTTKAASGAACATDCSGATLPSACTATDAGAGDAGNDAGDAGDDGATVDAGDDAGDDASASDAGTDAEAGTTPVTPTVDTCTSCVSSECGDAKKACAIGSECAAYLECTFAAADAAAADECGRQHATGKTAAAELATCTRVGCSIACGF